MSTEDPVTLTEAARPDVDRKTAIGSSEIASVLGLNEYQTSHDLWLIKTGRVPGPIENESMYWGKRHQKAVVEEYEKRRGILLVHMFDEPIRHPSRPWQSASPDATLPSESLIVEAKTSRYGKGYGPAGTDEVPESHRLQVEWQMSTLDYEYGHIAALIGGSSFRIYEFRRDRDLENAMLTAAEKWWREQVVADVPPEIRDSELTRDWLRKTFPRELAPLRPATEEETLIVAQYRAARKQQKHIEEIVGGLDVKIRAAIAQAEGLEGDGFRISYRKPKDSQETDWKAACSEMRTALGIIAETVETCAASDLQGVRELAESALGAIPAHTVIAPGSRRLLPKWEGEEE